MLKIIEELWRYRTYPHKKWADEIYSILNKHLNTTGCSIIDAPCGNGVITYWLLKKGIASNFLLIDLAEKGIQIAKNNLVTLTSSQQIEIINADIYRTNSLRSDDIWLLINSLYVFNDLTKLMEVMKKRVNFIIGIFPYLDRKNYLCLKKLRPVVEKINYSGMSAGDTIDFFSKQGYKMLQKKDITFIPFYCHRLNRPLLKFIISQLYIQMDNFYRNKNGYYWLGVFKRE